MSRQQLHTKSYNLGQSRDFGTVPEVRDFRIVPEFRHHGVLFFCNLRDPKAWDSPRIAGSLAEYQNPGTFPDPRDSPRPLELSQSPDTMGFYF